MPLHPQVKLFLENMSKNKVDTFENQSVEKARQSIVNSSIIKNAEPVKFIEDREIPGPNGSIPIRIYKPIASESLPALVFYHGGGWVIGGIDSHDGICRSLANLSHCAIISVDYRLAPEHKFPAAVYDAYTAAKWVFENADSIGVNADKIAVGGDSAGGNLAAVTAIIAKERKTPKIVYQVLIYPITDLDINRPSYLKNGEGFMLTRAGMAWFIDHYIKNNEDKTHPYIAPLLLEDLSGLPPAYVMTAEFDPLRDEGELYAQRLKEAGVPVLYKQYNGMIHGFIRLSHSIDEGKKAIEEIANQLKVNLKGI